MAYNPANTSDLVIDVSHWQGAQIDWARVKGAGKLVAMIKATQGAGTDADWAINRQGALANGIVVIPYMFTTQDDVKLQCDTFVKATGLLAGMPFAVDWEGNAAPPAAKVEAIGLALKAIANRDPLGYWGPNPPGNPTPEMAKWPRWIPRYGVDDGAPDENHPVDEPWLFWQYSSKAQVDGIEGNADASLFAGTQDELIAWCQTGALPA
jgi:lysozyme